MSELDFITVCKERGFFHQCTDEVALGELMGKETVTAYIGFDCTAKSLHVGSLLQIMLLRWLQICGHKPIVLMGGGTTKVGDPSGKDESRKMLTPDDIQSNMDGIKKVFEQFLQFGDGETDAIMVNNADWLDSLKYIDILRDVGKHISVNEMLTRDSVKLRLERQQHLSFLEFNYMILQAYDFVELNRVHGCRLQIGGSDQWGNILGGCRLYKAQQLHELVREIPGFDKVVSSEQKRHDLLKMVDFLQTGDMGILVENVDALYERSIEFAKKENITLEKSLLRHLLNYITSDHNTNQFLNDNIKRIQNLAKDADLYGLTSPLITTSSGAKMGKTASGAIWLDAAMLSPYDYWQFWRNTEDADVGRFLRMFTELSIEDIEKLEALEGAAINDAKKVLATEATTLLHGAEAAAQAAETAQKTFEQGIVGDALPEISVPQADLEAGIPAFKLFFDAGLESSGGKARKLITGGGAKVNDAKVEKEDQIISAADMVDGKIKLSAGKKRHVLVKAA